MADCPLPTLFFLVSHMGLSSIIFVSFISLALVRGKQKLHQLILAEKEAGVYKFIERAGGVNVFASHHGEVGCGAVQSRGATQLFEGG